MGVGLADMPDLNTLIKSERLIEAQEQAVADYQTIVVQDDLKCNALHNAVMYGSVDFLAVLLTSLRDGFRASIADGEHVDQWTVMLYLHHQLNVPNFLDQTVFDVAEQLELDDTCHRFLETVDRRLFELSDANADFFAVLFEVAPWNLDDSGVEALPSPATAILCMSDDNHSGSDSEAEVSN